MVLTAENLGLTLGKKHTDIFRDVSFHLDCGETALLAGKSGSGKTMLGIALCGHLPLWVGDFELSGKIGCLGKQVEQGGYLPDEGILLENPYTQLSGLKGSVREEMAFPLECRGIPREEMPPVIEEYGSLLGIERILDRPVRNLSGGELQRVLVACTLLSRPRFLFLDRPLTEIDTGFRPVLLDILRSRVKSVEGAALLAEDIWLMPGVTFGKTISLGGESDGCISAEKSGKGTRNKPSGELLRVEDISFGYQRGEKIIEHLSFSAHEGEIVFVTGRNGAGKTTLARIIAGMLAPQSGEIYYSGRPGRKMEQWEKAEVAGFAMQNPDLHFSRRTVGEELSFGGGELYPPEELLTVLGIDCLVSAHPLELTQAEKKRLVTALALGRNRKIVILDEPSQYQDEEGFCRLAEAILLTAAEGKTFLIVTHDPRFDTAFPEAAELLL